MANLIAEIQAVNITARQMYGNDITILVARAVAFGNDDNLFIVTGKRQAEAARPFVEYPGAEVSIVDGNTHIRWPGNV